MFRMRILDRYIFREILTPFFLSIAALTLVLFLQKMFRLAELVVSKGVTASSTAKLFAYIMPSFLVLTIPMSFLVGTLTAFTQLCSDSEVTAMKASRISLYNMIRPVMLFAVLAFMVTAFTSLIVVPAANHALKVHLFNMVKSRAMVGIEPGVFSSTFDGRGVKTIVLMRPMRAAMRAASRADTAASTFAPKKIAPRIAGSTPNLVANQ